MQGLVGAFAFSIGLQRGERHVLGALTLPSPDEFDDAADMNVEPRLGCKEAEDVVENGGRMGVAGVAAGGVEQGESGVRVLLGFEHNEDSLRG